MKIGYVRVSSEDQNIERQEVIMQELGVDRIFIDKMSGKNKERPQLKDLLNFVREGDCVVIESISRLARNTRDLLEIVESLRSKKVEFISKKETIDSFTPAGQFMLTVFGAIAELERSYILDRQREGIAIAKNKGKYKGRKPIEIDQTQWISLYDKWKKREIKAVDFRRQLGLKHGTFYGRLRQWEQQPRSI